MNNLFPENSYMGKCSCGKVFIATKGVIHCHNCLYAKIAELEKERDALIGLPFKTYKTEAAESVAGIALRQLGGEKLWTEIARLNSLKFPDVSANDYYPVGTILILPNPQLLEAHNLKQQAKGVTQFANKACGDCITEYQTRLSCDANLYCKSLVEQTKQLREGVSHE